MTTQFSINGKPYTVDLTKLPIDISLNTFIREHAGLPATKFMCQEGGCGVCVCAVTGKHPASGEVHTWAVNSCLTLLNSCTDLAITTAEGIGNKRNGYHAIQKRLAKMNGTQCGYCSPGFVMNMYALLQANGGKLTMEEVENSFGGNICRCTGYRPILDAMKSFAVDSNISIPDECRDIEDLAQKTCPKTGEKCSGSCGSAKRSALSYADGSQWYWAKTLGDIFDAFAKLGKAPYTLIAGNTAHGVYRRTPEIKHFVDINGVASLSGHTLTSSSLTLGGNLSLTETMEIFKEAAQKPGFEYCQQLWQHFDLIANVPVRNSGTLAGNLAIKHQHPEFPSDIYIVFEALAVQVILNVSASEQTTVSLNEFLQTPLEKKIISGFVLRNYPRQKYIFGSYKIMPRAQNAHAYVNAAFLVNIEKPSNRVISSRICFGGIDADYVHAVHIEKLLAGKSLYGNDVATQIFSGLQQSLKASISPPDASPEYRQLLAHGLLYKFLLANAPKVAEPFKSGGELLKRPVSSGKQTYETIEKSFPITKPTEKHEGLLQTSGEAAFANDLPVQANQVWGAFVTAKKVGATVTNIDTTAAFKLPGVVAFFSAKDIPGANSVTINMPLFFPADEELFLTGAVKFYNQPVGIIVAESNALANRAAELVELTYQGGSSEVLPTLDDVLESACADRIDHKAKSTIKELKFNSDKVDVTGNGKLDMGLQYHFFMEPQTTVVVPFEGALQVHSSTQWMDLVQTVIGNLVKMNYNEVQVKTRRVGGGYGGKATNCLPAACAAALAAFKLNRPVRFVQTLESMMDTLGKRWPCLVNYDFHVQKNGKIVALQTSFWEDAGYNSNGSPMGHTQLLSKNCYEFSDNFKLDGYMVFTDSPSNCACRAPGSVEGIAIIESIIEHIAFETGLDPLEVRVANLLPGHKMHQMLPHFIDSTKYKQRRPQIESFNEKNRWRKRGLGLCVMEYHMGYFGQYPATVAIYHGDGTVIVSHGGIEMGQGLNTKVAQVIAHDLGIPIELIRVEGSNTLNGANSMVTGGSIGSEQLCFAVRNCCNTLNARLKPVKESLKDASWKQLVETAYEQKVNLLASDYCKQDDMNPYTVCALGLMEVEVDILTGNYQLTRVDILEDAGESLNPSVDIGQIEGAFVMGLGYWTSEQCVVDKRTGALLTNRTWSYKPPGAKDIPIDFRIEMLPNSANTAGFMRSKATGEPAICLGVGITFALEHALQSARKDAGLPKTWIPLSAPMTPEVVLLNSGHSASQFKLESGTVAGNLAIKHQHPEFPSDIYIVFEALAVQVILNVSANEQTTVSLNEFLQTPLEKKIISGFVLRNYPRQKYIFGSYKIMPRAQNAHAYVNAAFLVNIEKPSNRVISSRICFGGIDADYVHAVHIEKLLAGKSLFGNDVATQIFSGLQQSLKASVSPPDASPEYRQLLAHGLLYKFLLANAPKVAEPFKSGGELLKRPVSSGKQTYETIEKSFPITKPTIKHEGLLQTSGEAAFANDLPVQANQVWGAFVSAKKVGATVTNIDATAALKVPGVVAFFSAKDIPGANSLIINMPLFFPSDEELFLTGAVKFYNQPVGIIVAESNALANRAAELVELTYEGGSSEILPTLDDVLESACADRIDHSAKSLIKELKFNSDKVDVTGKGKLDMGLQYHFFMEPQTTVVVPFEGALQVHCSTQWMDLVQTIIGNLVKMNYNEVQVKTRRVGGGYGGKVTNALPAACATALAAFKLNRPVRFVQTLESMMDTLGKRWPCLVNYDFHVQKNGKIVALQTSFWEDGGHNANFSPLGHTQLLSKNVYEFSDNFKLDGYIVFTDSPSNCACRAPGSVEGIAIIENIIEHIAFETGLDPLEVRIANLLPGHKMHQMLPHFIESTNYKTRRPQIEAFNEKNRWRKRGLGLCVMEYHMGYFGQYPATVAIYHGDGTVIVSHGGIEMGQGLNTKVAQVISHDLGIPIELIRVEGSNTLNGANSMVTGGSIGSEQLCFAVRNCCNTLNARLKPVKESLKDASWKQLVETAYEQKVNLLASDYCKQDDMNPYTVCALGLMEVEVDILTGNYQLTRVDILEDAGESLNPSVDIGQIEGAFVMGLGYWTSEQCVVDKRTGALLTNRTWNYKPPGAKDIPIDFRIEMLPNSANTAGFMRSKATGEPAICLSVGITFALEHALQSARKDAGLPKTWIPLSAPMTPEVVLLNAGHSASQFKLE